ncbi:g9943 [Coccomyxa viridis]|uniref:G9943 protein n=1 Tax=Coccomyxa viridis TaxID=1274662 RepID=A0ABP1G491_9CHLO
MAKKGSRGGLCACFRPKVAEADSGEATLQKSASALRQEKEDSANGDGPARLTVGIPQRTQSDELDEFGSPASSYVTCFSEQDTHDINDSIRSVSQRSLGVPTPRHSVDEHTASAAANRTVSQGSSPLTHPSSSGPAAKAELEAAYRQQLDSLTPQLEAAGLIPEWLKRFSPDEAPKQRRTAFPKPKQKLPTINIFNIIKDWIGKDLHKLSLPTHINEPLTDLQRRAEAFEASELLDVAALAPAQSLERLLHVTAFAISMYNTIKRVQKPFKNLEQSTYELIHLEKGLRCVGEKLRHIPMVHVMHCDGRGWQFSGNDEFYMHLRGNYALIRPVGELYVRFHDGDEYVWSTATTYVNNLLVGARNIDHRGQFHVVNLATDDSFQCSIKEPFFGKSRHEVHGHLERQGKRVDGITISGCWDGQLVAGYADGTRKLLWKANPSYLPNAMFPLSKWALLLNELTPEMRAKLPPTDDRLRPDMRLFEHGYFQEANDEKMRLEEKQRQERAATQAAGKPWQANWFEQVPEGRRGYETWRYKGGYWEARETGNWAGIREIYGDGPKGFTAPKLLY